MTEHSKLVIQIYDEQDNAFDQFKKSFLDALSKESRQFSNKQLTIFRLLFKNFKDFISSANKATVRNKSIELIKQLDEESCSSFEKIFANDLLSEALRAETICNFCEELSKLALKITNPNHSDCMPLFNNLFFAQLTLKSSKGIGNICTTDSPSQEDSSRS